MLHKLEFIVVFFCIVFCISLVSADNDLSLVLIKSAEIKLSDNLDKYSSRLSLDRHVAPHQILRTNNDSVMWLIDRRSLPTDKQISRFDIEKDEVKNFNLSQILNASNDQKIFPFVFNRPSKVQFDISPNGQYLLIRQFADKTILYDIENEKHVQLNPKFQSEKGLETLIGFDRNGNLYCGVQSVSPIVVLRDFNTGEILRQYLFPRLNYPPFRYDYSYWNTTKEADEIGLNFNYISSSIESPDGKYTLFTFTVYQFRCLFVILLICDNTSKRVISKHLLDSSGWDIDATKFVFDKDSKKLLFQDGRITLYCFDLERRLITSRFEVPLRGDEPERIAIAYEIESFFFTPTNEVVVYMRMPIAAMLYSGVQSPPQKPLKMTYLWDPKNEKISDKKPWIFDHEYALKYWISPDESTVAILSIEYNPNNFTIINPKEKSMKLRFWDIKNNKLLMTLIDNEICSVIFSKDWHLVDIITRTPQTIIHKRYNLISSSNKQNNHKHLPIINSEYRR